MGFTTCRSSHLYPCSIWFHGVGGIGKWDGFISWLHENAAMLLSTAKVDTEIHLNEPQVSAQSEYVFMFYD